MEYSILEIADILEAKIDNLHNASIDTLLTDSRSLTYPEKSLFSPSGQSATTGINSSTNFITKEYATLS